MALATWGSWSAWYSRGTSKVVVWLQVCVLSFYARQVRIVKHSFEIINLVTDQNPIQVLVDAIINRCELVTRN